MLTKDFLDELAHGSFIGDIDRVPFQFRPGFPRRSLQRIEALLRTVGNDDLGALLKECQRNGMP